MNRFFYQIAVFALLVIVSFGLILSFADGYTDPYYERFTSPRQSNLILGTSRAAQGVQPEVIKEILNRDFYNYSFTIGHSPFGPTYLESIKKKLVKNEQNGIFIITVDPWSISSITSNPNDSVNFREVNLCLGNTSAVNMRPNYIYLLKNLKGNFTKVLARREPGLFLHSDGWLEVTIDMDSAKVSQRTKSRLGVYKDDHLPIYKYSSLRFEYLIKTIEFLNRHGKVYLVRLPMHPEMMEIENQLMRDFDHRMHDLIPLTEGYYNLTKQNAEFNYTDGNHLDIKSGIIVSEQIANWIRVLN